MVRIELQFGEAAGQARSVTLTGDGDECVLGRSASCQVVVEDTMAADRHCRLYLDAGRLMVENLDEEIGTCLNGDFLADPKPVSGGSELLVGTTVVMVTVGAAAGSDAPVPAAPPAPVTPPKAEEPPTPAAKSAPSRDAGDTASETRLTSSWGVHPFEPPKEDEPVAASQEEAEAPTPEPVTPPPTPPTPSSPAALGPAPLGQAPLGPYQPPGSRTPIAPAPAPAARAAPAPAATPAAASNDRSEGGASASGAARSWAHAMTYSADSDLVTRIEADLRREYPDRLAGRSPDAVRAMVKRGVERGHGYGLEQEDHVYQFLRCMVMLDDEIDGRNPDTEDVWLTLNHARRTPAQRIERAVKIASRIAGERSSGIRSRPGVGVPRTPKPVAPVAAAPAAPAAAEISKPDDETAAGDRSGATHATRGTPPPPAEAATEDTLPEIEGFLIKEEIGAGGMGRVFLAYDNQLDKDVAIKVLRTVDPEAQEQLQHEARAAARLEHPNIVQVFQFEKLGRGGYYVMQFVRGLDASKLVKKFEAAGAHQLPGEQVLKAAGVDVKRSPAELRELMVPDKNAYFRLVASWIAGVADGLERAHTEGVLHRDIKPSNLLLSGDGRMMITDFGLAARPADRQGIGRARVGTPRYLSPERVADWASFSDEVQHQDARADVWSLGAVLYEFLTYRAAFKGSVPEVLRAIVTEAPAAPNSIVWSVPDGLQRICLMAMARRPDDRFSRSGDMAEALRGWIRVDTGIEKKGRIPFLP